MPFKHDHLNFIPITPTDKVKFNYLRDRIRNKYGVSCRLIAITKNYKYWVSQNHEVFKFKNNEPYLVTTKKVRLGNHSYVKKTLVKFALDQKVTRAEKKNFKLAYKTGKKNKKSKNSIFLEPVLENLVLYAVENLEDKKVFLGYDMAKNLVGIDLINYLSEDCKQSWVLDTVRNEGRSSIRVKLLTLGNTKNEIYELFGIYCALYENKKWSIVNIDYLRDETDHYFILPISKKSIRNKTYKPLVSKKFKSWLKEKRNLFSNFDNFVYDIKVSELEV